MATLLETASLVMVPSGYEDGTLGSLVPTDASGDFAFTRGSNLSATRVNEQGLIEKGYENLLLQSNNFDISPWTQLGVDTPISGQSGYDGTNDAWKVNSNANISNIRQTRNQTGLITLSVYAKKGEYDYVGLYFSGDAVGVIFSLIDGGVESPIAAYPDVYTNGENIGNGWYRFSITHNSSSTGIAGIYVCETTSYFGNTTTGEGIYIQDAQLNQGLAAYPYIETTAAPEKGGILADLPRVDYSSGRASLLLEPQRTNLVPHSEYYDGSSWTKTRIDLTINATTSPEGVLNASLIVPQALNGDHLLRDDKTFTSLTIGQKYTLSAFAKQAGYRYYRLYAFNANTRTTFDLSTGTMFDNTGDDFSITDMGNGWYRLTHTFTATATEEKFRTMILNNSLAGVYVGDGTSGIYVFGHQFEQEFYPTSYIPTYGTSQTRLADLATDAGNASTFNDSEGVLFFEGSSLADANTGAHFLSLGGVNVTNDRISIGFLSRRIFVEIKRDNVVQMIHLQVIDTTQVAKVAISYKENDCNFYINGVLVDSDTSVNLPSNLQTLNFSKPSVFNFYGNTNQVLYFPTALSDEACIELTTL